MDIYMIWASNGIGEYWLIDAWDSDSISDNRSGWDKAREKAYAEQGAENVRIVVTSIDFDGVLKAFEIPRISSSIAADEEDLAGRERLRILQTLTELRDNIPDGTVENRTRRRTLVRAMKAIKDSE